ncbi:MAG: DUF4114 domain-containing protein [Scytonema sp. PMC 1069.18]|nr:DUF4114 domain-containing protein [Scytonema sp. PMC 1069.18]MEC4886146.1 DUF4114 domain-containing protein [Scytonema sp. PMC 1070.18]
MVTTTVEKKQFTIESSKYSSKTSLFKISNTDIPALQAGDLLIINVESGNPYGVYDGTHPLNEFIPFADSDNYFYEFPFGSLVGTLDNGKTFFPIANHLEMTVLQPDGNLSFVFWGSDSSTSTNTVTLTVEVLRQKDLEQFNIPLELSNYFFTDRWQFDVDAKVNSVSNTTAPPLLKTGLYLQPGDLITVDVHPLDFWSLSQGNSNINLTTNGRRSDGTFYGDYPKFHHNFQYGSLVGTLDGGKTFFSVGTHLKMTVLTIGHLSFACWDIDYASNKGLVRAYVKVVRNGITITKPSNVANNSINLGQFTNSPDLREKIKFDPNTCIWIKANCKLQPPSFINNDSAVIITEPDKKYNVQITVNPGTAGYKNTFGIFPTSEDGSVAGVKPGEPNYAETAVRNRVKLANYNEESLQQTFTSELLGGSNYEVFLIANGTPEQFLQEDPKNETTVTPKAYFRTTEANPDKKPHIKALSEDTFGFEDMYGGGDQDFDDITVQMKVISVESTTTSSSSQTDNTNTLTENDCPLYPLCKLSQLNN